MVRSTLVRNCTSMNLTPVQAPILVNRFMFGLRELGYSRDMSLRSVHGSLPEFLYSDYISTMSALGHMGDPLEFGFEDEQNQQDVEEYSMDVLTTPGSR